MGRVFLSSLAFKPVEKRKVVHKKKNNKLTKRIYALCMQMDDDSYMAYIKLPNNTIGFADKFKLPFSPKSYDLTGKVKIFTHKPDKNNHYTCIIRDENKAKFFPDMNTLYTPLRKNNVFSGYIIKLDGTYYFDIEDHMGHYDWFNHLLPNKHTTED